MYVHRFTYVRTNTSFFRCDSGVKHGCVMFPWLFDVYAHGWDNERGIIMKRKGERFSDERREWRLPR